MKEIASLHRDLEVFVDDKGYFWFYQMDTFFVSPEEAWDFARSIMRAAEEALK